MTFWQTVGAIVVAFGIIVALVVGVPFVFMVIDTMRANREHQSVIERVLAIPQSCGPNELEVPAALWRALAPAERDRVLGVVRTRCLLERGGMSPLRVFDTAGVFLAEYDRGTTRSAENMPNGRDIRSYYRSAVR